MRKRIFVTDAAQPYVQTGQWASEYGSQRHKLAAAALAYQIHTDNFNSGASRAIGTDPRILPAVMGAKRIFRAMFPSAMPVLIATGL